MGEAARPQRPGCIALELQAGTVVRDGQRVLRHVVVHVAAREVDVVVVRLQLGRLVEVGQGLGQAAQLVVVETAILIVGKVALRSEEQTSEINLLMRISYDVLCLKKKNMERLIV